MEIIMISDCKLKVMLGEEDLRQFEIKAEELDYANTETKRMFWDILNRAKHQTGFDTDGQRVLVQLYPSKRGGCEMFVTKIGLLSSENEKNTHKCYYEEKNSVTHQTNKKNKNMKNTRSAFSFESIRAMIDTCKLLHSLGYVGKSSSYICDNGKKYLLLSDFLLSNHSKLNMFSFILEYSSYENAEIAENYLIEHGKCIFENEAVSYLAKL